MRIPGASSWCGFGAGNCSLPVVFSGYGIIISWSRPTRVLLWMWTMGPVRGIPNLFSTFELIRREGYQVVVVLLPTVETHGHHKTVALLTLQVVAELKVQDRPAILGVRTAPAEAPDPDDFFCLEGFTLEFFWLFDISGEPAAAQWRKIIDRLDAYRSNSACWIDRRDAVAVRTA